MIKEAIYKVINREDLSTEMAFETMNEIMEGKATEAQIGSLLTGLRMKGETVEEITGFASVMREKATKIETDFNVIDIVGTGGDEAGTFNISTTTAFVVAAAGVPVAKHGNRGVSSKCGAADLLEKLGVNITLTSEKSQQILKEIGLCFLFAPMYHSSMKYAAPVRKDIGVRTVFNLLGPLSNPAGAKTQLMGVFAENLVEPLAMVLANLGVEKGMVIHGYDGLDEVTLTCKTKAVEICNGKLKYYDIVPEELGFEICTLDQLSGGDIEKNAEITIKILSGEMKGPKKDIVILNAAVAIYLAEKGETIKECVNIANKVIESGAGLKKLNDFILMSNEVCK